MLFFVNKIGKDQKKKMTKPTVGVGALKHAFSYITHEGVYHLNIPEATVRKSSKPHLNRHIFFEPVMLLLEIST